MIEVMFNYMFMHILKVNKRIFVKNSKQEYIESNTNSLQHHLSDPVSS